eukprot:4360448-Lingulodinium_polyedra.AAC.1
MAVDIKEPRGLTEAFQRLREAPQGGRRAKVLAPVGGRRRGVAAARGRVGLESEVGNDGIV